MSPSTDLSFSLFPTLGRLILLDSRASDVDLLRTSFAVLEIEVYSSGLGLGAGFEYLVILTQISGLTIF